MRLIFDHPSEDLPKEHLQPSPLTCPLWQGPGTRSFSALSLAFLAPCGPCCLSAAQSKNEKPLKEIRSGEVGAQGFYPTQGILRYLFLSVGSGVSLDPKDPLLLRMVALQNSLPSEPWKPFPQQLAPQEETFLNFLKLSVLVLMKTQVGTRTSLLNS